MDVLARLVRASTQGHNQVRLEAEQAIGVTSLYARLPRTPFLSPRLRQLSNNPTGLKPMDADALVDAAAGVVGWEGHELSPDLLDLTLLVARLGGTSASFRIGLLAMQELRARTAMPTARLP